MKRLLFLLGALFLGRRIMRGMYREGRWHDGWHDGPYHHRHHRRHHATHFD